MFRSWISAQYNDIKGNAKWALLVALWPLMLNAGKFLLSLIPHIQSWEVWTVVLIASSVTFILILRSLPSLPSDREQLTSKYAKISESPLQEQALQLGRDLFAFLREVGPDPGNQLDYLHSAEDVWRGMSEKTGPYIERVRHGYLSRFKDRVAKTFHELNIKGIKDKEIDEWEIDNPQAIKPESVRKIAEHMYLIAAKMDIKEASKGT
jgi:hypothetical protein